MTLKTKLLSAWIILSLVIVACGISFSGNGLSDEEKLQTAVAQTIAANQQLPPQQPDQQTLPTITVAPANTAETPPTKTPEPCNKAQFISETIPDGTEIDVGDNYVKSWRLKNIGTCTWNTNYQLVFAEGDKMSGPSTVNFTQQVSPGEQIDLSVNLTAPNSAGTYTGFWKVRDNEGAYFVNNISVQIKAVAIGPPPVLKPDLATANFDITPSTPTQGANTNVKVRVKNIGNANAGAFTVKWYGLDTFANPSCTWNVPSLASGASVWIECNFVFASWYPVNKTTVVYLDTGNTVDESNEGNNTKTKSPFGVNP